MCESMCVSVCVCCKCVCVSVYVCKCVCVCVHIVVYICGCVFHKRVCLMRSTAFKKRDQVCECSLVCCVLRLLVFQPNGWRGKKSRNARKIEEFGISIFTHFANSCDLSFLGNLFLFLFSPFHGNLITFVLCISR